jgi:ribonuclease HI
VLSIFCDGSSHSRGGLPGGWAFIVVKDERALVARSGGEKSTTNNVMELRAALFGLREVIARGGGEEVELVSDSRFTLDIANGSYLPTRHLAEARELRAAAIEAGARTRWVRGHSGDAWNEKVDALAHEAKQAFVPARVKKKAERRAARG